jgi:hypothetical protein
VSISVDVKEDQFRPEDSRSLVAERSYGPIAGMRVSFYVERVKINEDMMFRR